MKTQYEGELNDEFLDELEQMEDQSQETTGGDRELPIEGLAHVRLVSYVELGDHTGTYQGKPKKKADREVRLTFELVHKRHTEGKDYPVILSLNTMPISTNVKSKFHKLFGILTQGDESIKHLARCLGKAYKARIFHDSYVSKKTGKEVKFATMINPATKEWSITAPIAVDEETGEETLIRVAPAKSELCCFVWNKPLIKYWNMLEIEGTTDDGRSKNWIQERCLEAENFKGSPLQSMLVANNLPTEVQAPAPVVEEEEEKVVEKDESKTTAQKQVVQSKVAKKATPVDEEEEEDAPVPSEEHAGISKKPTVAKKAKQVDEELNEDIASMAAEAGLLDD